MKTLRRSWLFCEDVVMTVASTSAPDSRSVEIVPVASKHEVLLRGRSHVVRLRLNRAAHSREPNVDASRQSGDDAFDDRKAKRGVQRLPRERRHELQMSKAGRRRCFGTRRIEPTRQAAPSPLWMDEECANACSLG